MRELFIQLDEIPEGEIHVAASPWKERSSGFGSRARVYGMSFAYGPADETESLRVLRRYLELGGNFLDTAEIYGPYTNEELLGRFSARDTTR